MEITLVLGDFTEQRVDAIVNAANSSLAGGGRDGAMHRGGGPAIKTECQELRGLYRDGLPTGQAVATTAGRLPAAWVIHTVGSMYSWREDRSHLLTSCYPPFAYPADSCTVYACRSIRSARSSRCEVLHQQIAQNGSARDYQELSAPLAIPTTAEQAGGQAVWFSLLHKDYPSSLSGG
ncbi:MAG TPA: macro domain-containing protein [Streptosporangiaceae bacterium]